MYNQRAHEKADQFLALSPEFRLGDLVTEQPHPETRQLSEIARVSVTSALDQLFTVDQDVVEAYRNWVNSDAPQLIAQCVLKSILNGGRLFFTGCGATGRLSILLEAIWRRFWKDTQPFASVVYSVMAGGDYALIKSVEGFEDFSQFGEKQLRDMGVTAGDLVFAFTEGGETPFVIGTVWEGLRRGAKVYFVYCNPDDVLRRTVARSRQLLDDPRIEKINLTTGPMAIMGSTRMQATSIQLCAMLTILEIVVRCLLPCSKCPDPDAPGHVQSFSSHQDVGSMSSTVCDSFLAGLEALHQLLKSEQFRKELASLVYLEETVYRLGRKSTYFADTLALDVLTDTTERSPTFCIPAFRKWGDTNASESWTYLILPCEESRQAWDHLLRRSPRALTWTCEEIRDLIGDDRAPKQVKIMQQIGPEELLKFRIGMDGLQSRPISPGDVVVCAVAEIEKESLTSPDGFYHRQIQAANSLGTLTAMVYLASPQAVDEMREFLLTWPCLSSVALLPLPETNLLLDGLRHVAVKLLLNALSTSIMVRLGRVRGNCMTAVVPSNLKLTDRATRYIQTLTGLSYEESCQALFNAIDYVAPRMAAGKIFPPVVELAVTGITKCCSLDVAESLLERSDTQATDP